MHVNEGKYFDFGKHGYDWTNEEPNDNDYNDVANNHGKENGNEGGHNNNRGEGGVSSTVVGSNNDAAFIGNGDSQPSNVFQEEPTKKGSNQRIELQDNPPPVDKNTNFEAPIAIMSAKDNIDLDKNVPISHDCQRQTLIGLSRPLPATSNKPPEYRGATVEHAIMRTSMNWNTNVGLPHDSGNPAIGQQSSEGSLGKLLHINFPY
jgi:hypothetical protein